MPMLERLLPELERDAERWEDYERRCRAAETAGESGLGVPAPAEPPLSMGLLLWLLLRAPASAPRSARAELVAALQARRRPLPEAFTGEDFVAWLVGEALAAGIACDYATPYQAWMVIAELLLGDADIGEIIARVHPERVDFRSPRLSEEDVKKLNADLACKERKRVDRKREAFGYELSDAT